MFLSLSKTILSWWKELCKKQRATTMTYNHLSMSVSVLIAFLVCLHKTVAHNSGLQAQRFQKFMGLIQPEQIHLAFGNTAQDMVIMWATKRDGTFHVEFAESADKLQKIESEKEVLKVSSERASKYLHRVYLSKLKPAEKYVYRIVGDSGATSSLSSFTMPDTTPKKIHTFMMLADMGLSSRSLKFLVYEVTKDMYEAVFHIGDIAYNLHLDKGSTGDLFLKRMEKFAAKVPYMTVPGDHERFHDYLHYRYRFSMPNTPWPMPKDQLWYSIDIGPIHFITINTEVFYSLTEQQEEQLDWLQEDLQNVNAEREQHPWIIVLGHRPMYCSSTDSDTDSEILEDCTSDTECKIRSKLEDLFFEEGVDLYISGHRHNYERSWPLYRGKVFQRSYFNPKAPVHVINGAMGYQYLTETIGKPHSWSAFSLSDYRKELFGKLQVLNSTHLKWDVHDASNSQHIDSILIIQRRHGSFGTAGDDTYETLQKLKQLPPAPLDWHPPEENTKTMLHALYKLPPSTRKIYLLTVCCTLLAIVLFVFSFRRVRRKMCKW